MRYSDIDEPLIDLVGWYVWEVLLLAFRGVITIRDLNTYLLTRLDKSFCFSVAHVLRLRLAGGRAPLRCPGLEVNVPLLCNRFPCGLPLMRPKHSAKHPGLLGVQY